MISESTGNASILKSRQMNLSCEKFSQTFYFDGWQLITQADPTIYSWRKPEWFILDLEHKQSTNDSRDLCHIR